jgi:hypothetical protein
VVPPVQKAHRPPLPSLPPKPSKPNRRSSNSARTPPSSAATWCSAAGTR